MCFEGSAEKYFVSLSRLRHFRCGLKDTGDVDLEWWVKKEMGKHPRIVSMGHGFNQGNSAMI